MNDLQKTFDLSRSHAVLSLARNLSLNSYAKSKHTHSEYFVQNNTKTPPVI